MQFSGSHMIVVMIAIVVIMLVIMLAMVVIMMVMVTPFAIDLFIVVLLNMSICCMCDITTTAGSSRSQECGTTDLRWIALAQGACYAHDHMYTSVKLTCTCLLLLVCLCN